MFARAFNPDPRPALCMEGNPLVAIPVGEGSPAAHLTAAQLTGALVRGDAAALDRIYREHLGAMVGLARRASGRDESFALDAVHDAFVRIIAAPRVCDTDERLRAWLRRAVLSAVIDRLRTQARRRRREHGVAAAVAATGAPSDAGEQLAWLAGELRRLSPTDRHLVALRYRAELSLAEIARQPGTSGDGSLGLGAIHGRIRRAIQRLRLSAMEFFE